MKGPAETLVLQEYQQSCFSEEKIPIQVGRLIQNKFSTKITLEPPSSWNEHQWKLTPGGWVGFIPLTENYGLSLAPRVPLKNLFGMLAYAYRLRSIDFFRSPIECKSLEEFYEYLAEVLAKRVLDRGRKGFYREYIQQTDRLAFVRGRLQMERIAQTPWNIQPWCHFEEHSADIEENQILSWTLRTVARCGLCSARVMPTIRRAYHVVQGVTRLTPFDVQACIDRQYNRLNKDYWPMHALCRFFLEHSSPKHETGETTTLPFLVNMPRLFELFVAEWLKVHLPSRIRIKAQDRVPLGASHDLYFNIDLTLYDALTGKTLMVLDTKYKSSEAATTKDVAQVIAYAEAKNCMNAVLIYPKPLEQPLDIQVNKIRVRSAVYQLDTELEKSGNQLLQNLLTESI